MAKQKSKENWEQSIHFKRGCSIRVEGAKLICEVDLTNYEGFSSKGKTIIVGTSSGPKGIPGWPGFSVGVNVFKYPDATFPTSELAKLSEQSKKLYEKAEKEAQKAEKDRKSRDTE